MANPQHVQSFQGTERFEVLRRLGEGGMGVVYEAQDRERNLRVALKSLPSVNPSALLRLKKEFRALQDLHHPNLVRYGELFEANGQWFFTLELIQGIDLLSYVCPGRAAVVESTGSMSHADLTTPDQTFRTESDHPQTSRVTGDQAPQDRVPHAKPSTDTLLYDEHRLRTALPQLLDALDALHAAGLVHRDIKPSNVMIEHGTERLILLDFGLVGGHEPGQHSTEDHVMGTAAYMAPEQGLSSKVGPPADWYAVGVMFYQFLTGHFPFYGPPLSVLLQKQQLAPKSPSELGLKVPSDLELICTKLLEKDPQQRYSSKEIRAELKLDLQQVSSK